MSEVCEKKKMNYARYLNSVSLARQPSPIRLLTALLVRSKPSMISLAGGNPNPDLFPFQEAHFKLRDGTTLHLPEDRLKIALQYGATQGMSDFVAWLKTLQETLHSPPTFHNAPADGGTDICITPGSADAISKSFEMLVSPGDSVLLESPTYAGTLAAVRPMNCKLLPVATDHDGMIPSSLRDILSHWKVTDADGHPNPRPKIVYTIPNGVNPTGASLSDDRKKEIYQIAREYDLLILEDDPYYFLQYQKPRAVSFLSMDIDGRVLRFDSFSKIMSSGIRIGFVTGPQPLVERIVLHQMASSMHSSTLSQMMVSELVARWGIDGLERHVDKVVEFYRNQKDTMIAAAEKWLTGLAEWKEPKAGMFLWMKLNGIPDTKPLIEEKAQKKEVLLVPGYAFALDPSQPSSYVRASFSLASPEQIDKGFERLASLIKEELAENNNKL